MNTIGLILFVGVLAGSASAAEFTRWSTFKSPEDFVTAAKAFKPADEHTDLTDAFTTHELGEGPAAEAGTPVPAKRIEDCTVLWSDKTEALVFATATPPTQATCTQLGVLFLLIYRLDHWQIADSIRFTATGKNAEVSAALTAEADRGNQLDSETFPPVVTIKETIGGAYSYDLSASYSLGRHRLLRRELE